MARLIDADSIEYSTHLEPFGNGQYEYVEISYRHWIDNMPPVDAIPIEWIEKEIEVCRQNELPNVASLFEALINNWRAERKDNDTVD